MTTLAIIQARMGSQRLPGKTLRPLCGRPLISWVVERARRSRTCDQVVVATGTARSDDPLVDWCRSNGVDVFRGSNKDVLARFVACARQFGATNVVRLTGDNPLFDWRIVDRVAGCVLSDPEVQYATINAKPPTYPVGMGCEALPFSFLERMGNEATSPLHREHVTPWVRLRPDVFRHATVPAPHDMSQLRLTVDYENDLRALDGLMRDLQTRRDLVNASLRQILMALDRRPDLMSLLDGHQCDLWRREEVIDDQRKAA